MNAHRLVAAVVGAAVFVGAGTRAAGQAKAWVGESVLQRSWVGESVLPTKRTKDITFVDRIDFLPVSLPFSGIWPIKVRDDRGGWLRIHDHRREGWALKADFVLVRDASAYFHGKVQANPGDAWALFMRGEAWLQKGEPDAAIRDFNECLRLDPKDASSFNSRGEAWYYKKEYDKAIQDFGEAIRLKPTFAVALSNRGLAWQGKKEYDKAIQGFDEAIRLDPQFAHTFYNKACCFALQGKTNPALENLGKALELGYRDFEHMKQDPDLDPVRNEGRYQQLLEKYAK